MFSGTRRYSTHTSGKRTVLLIGGRGLLGETLRRRFLASDWNVICTTQGFANDKFDDEDFHLVGGVNLANYKSWTKEYWNSLLNNLKDKYGEIHTVVNCAGVAINDPKSGVTMDDINRKPIDPMLNACKESDVKQFTFISTLCAGLEQTRTPDSYALSKYEAECDISKFTDNSNNTTRVTIIRPDLIVSADNAGHFGGPQRMSTLPFKVSIGLDARNAGNTPLQPVSAYDVADAIVNISKYDAKTSLIVNASGPEVKTISELANFFKKRQNSSFWLEFKVPTSAIMPIARQHPVGALEPEHVELIEHCDRNPTERTDTTEFANLIRLSRKNHPNDPLMTMNEVFDFKKNPSFGSSDLINYTKDFMKGLKVEDIPALAKAGYALATESIIDFQPHKKSRSPDDGVSSKTAILAVVGAIILAHIVKSQKEDKEKQDSDKPKYHAKRISSEGDKVSLAR
jgi:nucleoside-diphosphate-sugar epimerase